MSNAYAKKRYKFKNITTVKQWLDILNIFDQKLARLHNSINCERWYALSVDVEQYLSAITELREQFKRTYGELIMTAINESYGYCFTAIDNVYRKTKLSKYLVFGLMRVREMI